MQLFKRLSFLSIVLAGASIAPAARAQAPARATPDWVALIGPYPQLGSKASQDELAVMLWLQNNRTPAQIALANAQCAPDLGIWAGVLAPGFEVSAHPKTMALMEQARLDLIPILDLVQETFPRPKPYLSYPVLVPALPTDSEATYPSAHAALGVIFGQIIAQYNAPRAKAIAMVGREIGFDHVLAGLEWPSDVAAGQALGRAFATWWINNPEHMPLFKGACAEWQPGR